MSYFAIIHKKWFLNGHTKFLSQLSAGHIGVLHIPFDYSNSSRILQPPTGASFLSFSRQQYLILFFVFLMQVIIEIILLVGLFPMHLLVVYYEQCVLFFNEIRKAALIMK